MDLIQALEKLSLEIRNNINDNQLEDFEQSLNTLLGQISELGPGVDMDIVRPAKRHKGSLSSTASTSQEEDSDCSSHQSNVPIFMDMLERGEYANITNSVRNISKILSLGNEIESIYEQIISCQQPINGVGNQDGKFLNHCFEHSKTTNATSTTNLGRQKRSILDNTTCTEVESLCKAYKNLYANCAQHVKYFPKISKYNQYCDCLSNYLCNQEDIKTASVRDNEFSREIPADTKERINNNGDDGNQLTDNSDTSGEDYLDEDDVHEIVECNQTLCDVDPEGLKNWTENKLYMTQ